MKKSIVKTLAVTALVLSLGASSAFAKTSSKNPFGHPQGENSERCFDFRNSDFQMQRHPMHPGMAGGRFGGMFGDHQKIDLLGTVSSVDAAKSLVTVKDADGKETSVHVTSFTHLIQIDKNAMKKPPKADKTADEKSADAKPELPAIPEIKLEDLKVGASVMVKKFDVSTKTIEAARILTIKE